MGHYWSERDKTWKAPWGPKEPGEPMPTHITHIERVAMPDTHVAIHYWILNVLVVLASLGAGVTFAWVFWGRP